MKHLSDIAHFVKLTDSKITESYNPEKKSIKFCAPDKKDKWILRNYAEILSSANLFVEAGDGFIEIHL